MVARSHRERLGDPAGLNPERLRRGVDGRGAVLDLDQPQVRGVIREPGPHRFRAHSPIRWSTMCRSGVPRRCSNRKMPCQVPSASLLFATGIELGLGEGGPKVRRHVVGPLVVVLVRAIFRCDALEIALEVTSGRGSGIS